MPTTPQLPHLHLLRCPRCGSRLGQDGHLLKCRDCRQEFALSRGIPCLYHPHEGASDPSDVTARIRQFYEQHPFPDYDDFDSLGSLMDKARRGVFARLLDEQIPFGARVLEAGCGTGQLSSFLGIAHRTVLGTDLSLSSLRLAQEFRDRHNLERVFFLQMNLFRPVFAENSFDVVICNGVLHHTSHPYAGFQRLARLVRPGGHLIVGLYHRWGRLGTDLRRILFRITGERWAGLDPRLRRAGLSAAKRKAWFEDQYRNPHEVKYTISDTLDWFSPNGLQLIKTIPKTRLGSTFSSQEQLFDPEPPGRALARAAKEFSQLWRGAQEGGFFTLIARKQGVAPPVPSSAPGESHAG